MDELEAGLHRPRGRWTDRSSGGGIDYGLTAGWGGGRAECRRQRAAGGDRNRVPEGRSADGMAAIVVGQGRLDQV